MQSRALLNFFLLVLVVLLSAYVYFSNQQKQVSSPEIRLTQLSAEQVTRINIRHNEREIELQKGDDTWRMLHPIAIEANKFRVDTLLNMLDTAGHAAYKASELDLGQYGLADPATSIRFNDEVIEFGITNPINDYRYVRAGDSVHLIDDHFYPLLSSQVGTLVARELIGGGAEIVKLELPEQTLHRDDSNRWHSSADIDPDAINEALYHWNHAQAFGVHNYMPRESLGDIRVHLAGASEPIEFMITDTDPWLIIARPDLDIEYHFNLEFYDRLLRPGGDAATTGEKGTSTEASGKDNG